MIKFVVINHSKGFSPYVISDFTAKLQGNRKITTCCIYESGKSFWKTMIKLKQGNLYFLDIDVETYKLTSQILIHIYPQEKTTSYDNNLEVLKIIAKDIFLNSWEGSKCIWLEDLQMLELTRGLNSEINRAENALRYFINMIMLDTFGVTWWDDLVPAQLKEEYNNLSNYKREVPVFKNVYDYLLSIDAYNLMDIMTIKINRWNPYPNDLLEQAINENNALKALELLKQQCETVIDLWRDVFSHYFDDSFKDSIWKDFCNNCSHISHNKLLDYDSFLLIEQNINEAIEAIDAAHNRFKNSYIPQNEKTDLREAALSATSEREALKERIERESGISILNEEEIFSEMKKEVFKYVSEIAGCLYFRKDLNIYTSELDINKEKITILKIESKIKNNSLTIDATLDLLDGAGCISAVLLDVELNGKVLESYELQYVNGLAVYNEETLTYAAKVQNELITKGMDEFFERLMDTIDNNFPWLMDNLDILRYQIVKSGEADPIGNFPCEACGEEAVCLDETICTPGICVNCGHKNLLGQCSICGHFFKPSGNTESEICAACNIK